MDNIKIDTVIIQLYFNTANVEFKSVMLPTGMPKSSTQY